MTATQFMSQTPPPANQMQTLDQQQFIDGNRGRASSVGATNAFIITPEATPQPTPEAQAPSVSSQSSLNASNSEMAGVFDEMITEHQATEQALRTGFETTGRTTVTAAVPTTTAPTALSAAPSHLLGDDSDDDAVPASTVNTDAAADETVVDIDTNQNSGGCCVIL